MVIKNSIVFAFFVAVAIIVTAGELHRLELERREDLVATNAIL